MRRRRIGEPADRQRVKALLKKNNPGWKQARLTALKMSFNMENSTLCCPIASPSKPRQICGLWLDTAESMRCVSALISVASV